MNTCILKDFDEMAKQRRVNHLACHRSYKMNPDVWRPSSMGS